MGNHDVTFIFLYIKILHEMTYAKTQERFDDCYSILNLQYKTLLDPAIGNNWMINLEDWVTFHRD